MKLITLLLPLPSTTTATTTLLSPKPQLLRFKFKPQSSLQTTINPPKSPFPPNPKSPVIIIGGGLAGLAAATHLNSQNTPFLLLEASDGVGGRVRTGVVDGKCNLISLNHRLGFPSYSQLVVSKDGANEGSLGNMPPLK